MELLFKRNLKDNIEELKKKGEVIETETEENGLVTNTIEFVSKDGNVKIKQSTTKRIQSEEEKQLISLWKDYSSLQDQKQESVRKEDYFKASKIKEKQEQILNKIKQVKNEPNTRTIE